ncbi:hypothetical protein SCUCBS95973_008399 [Sporothrix curviconia]|uniref:Major facilitator superfamily (MFS) profile domain-containing protein n=1 Tax=Sporothrix curviconia TaxID=1260050 RepID=A0ABP0CL83_9PEZI
MGIRQNIRLWENYVEYINEDGVEVAVIAPRVWPQNPIKIVRLLSPKGVLFFLVGLLAWACDGYDYNSVNLVATNLATVYNVDLTDITLSVTLTLIVRPVGAIIFGLLADMFGRKWVLSANLWILAVLQIGTAYAPTFGVFVGVRTLFGCAMGGIWGMAAALALENMPVEARGLFSVILQNGYAMGYVLAAMVNIVGVPNTQLGYKVIFFAGAGFTGFMAIVILFIPESAIYAKEDIGADGFTASAEGTSGMATGINPRKRVALFARDARLAARKYWRMFLFSVLFASVYNWETHACQDIFPSYLKVQKGFTARQASLAAILGQCGAIIGGPLAGYYSQFFGRRQTSIVCILVAWAFIPLFTLPTGYSAIMAGTFCLLTFVNASWGIMPILLNEYSPPQFRAVFPGTVYQLGNLISAPAAQSQTAAASRWIRNGLPNYSQVMTIFMCVVFFLAIVVCALGPEKRGSHFEVIKRAGAMENILREEMCDEKQMHLDADHVEDAGPAAPAQQERVETLN